MLSLLSEIPSQIQNELKAGLRTRRKALNYPKIPNGSQEVQRDIVCYSLDVIISVGYRVKSKRETQNRIWANKILNLLCYIIKGYTLNQKRLQQQKLQGHDEQS